MKQDFEARRNKRIENAQNRAIKNQKEAEHLYQSATEMANSIPFGQPVLIGHHSERRDRQYRDKIHDLFGKSFERQRKAAYYDGKAETIENNDAIFSDDPKVMKKLTEKVNDLKAEQEFMKAANRCLKRGDKEAFLKLDRATVALWEQLNVDDRLNGKGYPHFKLTNSNANIRRIEQRIQKLKQQEVRQAIDQTVKGIRIFENRNANRLQVIFERKPSDLIRKNLKSSGFRWSPSESAWQRHISNAAYHAALEIANSLQ